MNRKFIGILFLSLVMYTKEAYAVFDFMALIQTVMEQGQNAINQVQEAVKKIQDLEKRVRQGFDAAKGVMACVSNPSVDQCKNVAKGLSTAYSNVKNIEKVVTLGAENSSGDLYRKDIEKIEEGIQNTIYKKGMGDDISRLRENRRENNAVVAQELAMLFAKGVVTRQMILQEDGSMYQSEFTNGEDGAALDEVLNAQKNVRILSDLRLAQILEMRAFMISAQAAAELTLQSRESDEQSGQ